MNAVALHETHGSRHCPQSNSAKPHRTPTVGLVVGCTVLLVASAVWSGRAAAQTITEIIDSTGDGAGNSLFSPRGIVLDAAGNAYVVGGSSDNAFKITPGGMITEILDSSGDGAGNILNGAQFIALDAGGNAYVTGGSSDNAFKITPGGTITEIIDATGDGVGNTLSGPQGIAVDAAGNVYMAGNDSHNAFKITPGGTITEIIDATGDGGGNVLDSAVDIAVDAAGNMYVAGEVSDNAFKITPGGMITEIIDSTGDGGGNALDRPRGIAVDAAGNVYLTAGFSDNAFKITPGGTITEIIDASGDGAGNGLNAPTDVAVDGAENVYLAGFVDGNAFEITPGGMITEIIDATGDGAGNGLIAPTGMALDAAGNAYVTGRDSHNAFKITFGGVITGACCFIDGSCIVDTQATCIGVGGTYQGDGTGCAPNPCPQPTGACCFIDGSCTVDTQANCDGAGGTYQGDGTGCAPNPCPQPTGACCFVNGSCTVDTQANCTGAGGTYQGDGTGCAPNPCPPPTVACCFIDGTCQDLTVAACGTAGGTSQGVGTSCGPATCEPVRINEIRVDQPSPNPKIDVDEYFELSGPAGADLGGLTYLVIGDFGPNGGVIEEACALTGQTILATGFFVAAEDDKVGATNPNPLITSLNFENNDNVSHMLVEGFFGAVGDDLDTDDDGVLDLTPWTQIIDEVALVVGVFGEHNPDPVYTAVTVGPSGPFVPGHVFRDLAGTWQVGNFNILTRGLDTPGTPNDTAARGGGPVAGACCIGASCSLQTEADCIVLGGIFIGPDTTCAPTNFCVGSCCLGASCTLETQADCIALGGFFRGNGTDCTTAGCPVASVVLNEIWSGDPHTDDVEFVELFRPLGSRGLTPPILAGLSFIVVNGDTEGSISSSNYLQVTYQFNFGIGDSVNAGCFFLMGTASAAPAAASPLLGCVPPILGAEFPAGTLENHSQTYALVRTQDLAFCSDPANPTVAPAGCPTGVDAHRLTSGSVAAITANLIDAVATRDVDPGDHVYFGAPVVLDGMFQSSYMQRKSDGVDTDTAGDWEVQWNLELGEAGSTDSRGEPNTVGIGACCDALGACTPDVTKSNCETVLGGVYKGNGSTCSPNPCIGACCEAGGGCSEVTAAACATSGGVYFGDGVECPFANCAGETIAGARALGEPLGMILSGVTVLSVDDVMGTDLFKTIQLRDATGAISVVGLSGDIDPILAQVQVGDVIDIAGTTEQYIGLFELAGGQTPLQLVSNAGPPGDSTTPVVVSTQNFINGNVGAEALESDLVRLDCVSFFSGGVGVFQADVTYHVSDGTVTVPARVHVPASATSLIGQPIPVGAVSLTGIFWQQDFDLPTDISPENQGYQLRLRKASDIGASSCVEPLAPCCAPSGACACAEMTEGQCLLLGGTVIGPVGIPCPPPGACEQFRVLGDIDGNLVVTLADMDIFVKALIGLRLQLAQLARADLDCSGGVNGLDIPLMITALVP